MRKFLSVLCCIVALGMARSTYAQVTPGPANQAGLLYASNFSTWTVPQGNVGPYSWSNPQQCTVTSGGITFKAFTVGTPVMLVDTVNSAHTEVVTPTAVNISGAGCSITINPVYSHTSFYFTTSTGGLQEAINWAGTQLYSVILTPDWTRAGGVTADIAAAVGNSQVSILDQRNSCLIAYAWSGSAYAEQANFCTGGSSGVTSIVGPSGPATGTVTFAGSGVSQSGNTFTFNGGTSLALSTNGTPNASQSALNFSNTTPAAPAGYTNVLWQNSGGNESAYVPQTSSTSGAQCFLGTAGLVGAFTDSSGVVKQPLCIGNGPTSLQVPTGATQLLLGVDDNKFSDNGGSFIISASVNGGTATQYTVQSTSEPWDVTANPSYTYGTTGGTAPILGPTGLNPGDTVTITYVSGTVSCFAGTKPNVDANGYLTNPPGNADCAGGPTGTYVDPTYGKFPTYYMGSGGGSTFNALTAAATGGAAPGTTFNGSAPVTLDYHSFGAPGISGTPATGNCVDWASASTLGDTGSPCGSGSGGVTQITGPSSTVTGAMTFTGAGVSQSGNTFTFSGGGGSSQPTPFAYTFFVSAGTTYAVNNQTQTVAYSGTDAAVIINDVLGATVTTGATLYFKPGTYNLNSCTLETVTYTTLCYAVGIPATNSGTNYPQFKFIGDSTMSGSQNSPATSGVIFNVTSAAVTAAGTNTLAAFWMRPSTVQNSYYSGSLWWNDHIEFENFAINFPDNTHANEVAIDALEASYLGLKDVQAGFVTAPTALGAANSIAFITPATPSDGSRLVNSYASPGWNTGFQINTEHSYLEATVSYRNTTGYSYGGQRDRNNSPIYHNSQMVGVQCYDDVNCLSSSDANVASGSQLDIVGLDLEYINTGVWAYSTGFTTGANLGGLLSWTNTLTSVGRGSLTTPFPAGSGKNYAVISPTANATLGETAINDQNTGSNVNAITVLCPNIATGSTCSIPLGTSIGNWNNIYASFHYSGAGSSSNSFSIQFNGSTDPQLNLGQTSELSGGTSAMLAQTGDTYGETSVTLENRSGANGAIFQQYNGAGIDVFDLGFRVHTGLGYNLRLEKRSSSYINGLDTNGEFQFADTVDAGCTTTACIFGAIGNGGFTLEVPLGFTLKSTAAITGAVPVKVDTANANQVVATTTTDTGAGLVIGVCNNSPSSGANCAVVTSGVASLTLGTGTCAIGNFVIVDTTTNGDVKCTATYTAGTVIGVAMAAQSTVGSKFNVMVGLR